ncbi:glycosyltransferase family 4 protein [Escherichia coli]|nr:glycosyltransferase family 4 protein [Escherichia coli]EFC4362246.1 glycosyltransferase family 4 protein [Escherichia coli]EFD1045740.1 glycosyltransferase family 4 protein [Escherichia coli]
MHLLPPTLHDFTPLSLGLLCAMSGHGPPQQFCRQLSCSKKLESRVSISGHESKIIRTAAESDVTKLGSTVSSM